MLASTAVPQAGIQSLAIEITTSTKGEQLIPYLEKTLTTNNVCMHDHVFVCFLIVTNMNSPWRHQGPCSFPSHQASSLQTMERDIPVTWFITVYLKRMVSLE